MKKKATPSATEVEVCKRAFWEDSALFAFRRARERVRGGKPIDEQDRELVAAALEQLADQERAKIRALSPVQLRGHIAEYLADKLRMSLDTACAAFGDGISPDSIRKAIDRRRAARRARAKQRKGTL